MHSNKPNICIVGGGGIGAVHARNLSPYANPYCFNPTIKKAEIFNLKFDGSAIFDSFAQIHEAEIIDALLIASAP